MAINVNTVYTTVLSILNKEQRGYLTPYEFNQLATQVQLEIFENFFEDMGERPEKLTIDRIDNSKGYYKQNCRWATLKGQANNKTNNNLVEYKGEIKNISQWANVLGKNRSFIYSRIKDGQLNLS